MSETTRLLGRSALVTGASRGIGREVALRLSREGAQVWALARSQEALEELAGARALGRGDANEPTGRVAPQSTVGGAIQPVVCDLKDDAAVWNALDELTERTGGPPDIVVNSAGVFGVRPLAEETVNDFDAHLEVNLRAPFLVIRALLPAMLERSTGIIVNVGSVSGYKAFPGNGAYSASKFGLRGLHEVLVEEVRGTGVRAVLVEPSATDTELWDPLEPETDPSLPDRGDMLQPGDVADAILFAVTRPEGVSVPVLRIERG